MFRNVTNREKFLAIATISVALLALVYNFIIDPIIGQWSELDKKINKSPYLDNIMTKCYKLLNSSDKIIKNNAKKFIKLYNSFI